MTATCIDCVTEGVMTDRPTPHRGPRCATHHRRKLRSTKKRAQERRRERTYGIDADDHALLDDAQDGLCAVCRRRAGSCVDHDHDTGIVRGLLCHRCNRIVLGKYAIDVLESALAYLADPPAPKILGRVVVAPIDAPEAAL